MGATVKVESGWKVRSSAEVREGGAALSQPGAPTAGWLEVARPVTVLAALVETGELPNPFRARNYDLLPGRGPAAENFSNFPMPADSPFAVPWWYRVEFDAPEALAGEGAFLHLDGLNYRANVWLNGERIASASELVGAYREHLLDVSRVLRRAGKNVLALEVFPPQPNDLAITWVDWNASPPDKNLGLFRGVRLSGSGPLALHAPYVTSRVTEPSRALLLVGVDVVNVTARSEVGLLRGRIGERTFEQSVSLAPGERRRVEFRADEFAALDVPEPQLWWPRSMGGQPLYRLELEVEAGGVSSDEQSVDFGIRQITSELNERGHRLFRVNGKPILIRGAGWANDMMLRLDEERERAELEYVKHLNLNTIRFEGMLPRRELLDRCDREGILVIAGWCCCDHWEKWDAWKEEDHVVSAESLRSQVRLMRNHPCMLAWWYGSDFAPPPRVEQRYLDVFAEERWPNPTQSSAANRPTELTGSSGMKMCGPYDYVPPSYWTSDKERGGAFGFATEICPGAAVPPVESLREMLSEEHLWPVDDVWALHAGCKEFANIRLFTEALEARYGVAQSVTDFARKAQLLTYEAERAMFEAYSRNKYVATGVIQWMLNNAWPSLIWHLYDHSLRPAGGFFGTRKACEPVHVQFCYGDRSVVVVTDRPHPLEDLCVEADLVDLTGRVLFSRRERVSVPADAAQAVFQVPEVESAGEVTFLRLRLREGARRSDAESGLVVSENLYWLSQKPDVLDHSKGNWFTTPCSSHADFRSLNRMVRVALDARAFRTPVGDKETVTVRLKNASEHLAFFVCCRLVRTGDGREVLPILWEDNYVSLLPGETRELVAEFGEALAGEGGLRLELEGWNVIPCAVTVTDARRHSSGAPMELDGPLQQAG